MEDGFVNAMLNVDKAAMPFDDNDPYRFPDPKNLEGISKGRRSRLADGASAAPQRAGGAKSKRS